MTLAAVAVGLGVLGALALGRVMENLLFGVGARDPLTLATVAAGLLLTAFAASALPAVTPPPSMAIPAPGRPRGSGTGKGITVSFRTLRGVKLQTRSHLSGRETSPGKSV
jgi:hypothetical protein